jgi:ketosteroid isomerase-like protein
MSSQENPAVSASERKANVAVARGFYEAADVPAMLEFVDPQIEWRGPASLPWRGTFRGYDGFREFFPTVADRIAKFPGEKQGTSVQRSQSSSFCVRSAGPWAAPSGTCRGHVRTARQGKAVSMDNYVDTATLLRTLSDMN